MIDLTKNTTPFGLMEPDAQKALRNHPGPIEIWYAIEGWRENPDPWWTPSLVYRVKPQPREWWLNVYKDGTAHAYPREAEADRNVGRHPFERVRVREVMEGEQ